MDFFPAFDFVKLTDVTFHLIGNCVQYIICRHKPNGYVQHMRSCGRAQNSETDAGVWCDTKYVVTSPITSRYNVDASDGDAFIELVMRCRHAIAVVGDLIFSFNGFCGGKS